MSSPGQPPTTPANGADHADRLESWKEIASYLGKDVRTVQRWEKREELPVHRLLHEKQGSVYAYKSELDAWWKSNEPVESPDPENDAEAEFVDEPDEESDPPVTVSEVQPPRSQTALWAVGVIIVLFAIIIGLVISHPPSKTFPKDNVRIVVLPLQNLSGDPDQIYFSIGMTDEITADLSRSSPSGIGVIARSTAEKMTGKPVDEIRRALDVDYVVEGSVFRDGDKVRITAELIQARDQTHVWAKSYESELKDVIGVQRDVAQAIAAEITSRTVKLNTAPQVKPDAYDAFLRGRYFWNKRGVDSLQKSMAYFKEAIQRDPTYAPPYAGLADAYSLLGSAQTGAMPPKIAFPLAKAAAQKAVSLDASLAEPHTSLGYIELVYERDLQASEREFREALKLNPHYATGHQWFGLYWVAIGNTDEALKSVLRAQDEDPLSLPVNISLAEAYYFARQFDKAVAQATRAIELDNQSALAHYNRGRALEQQKKFAEAVANFQEAKVDSPINAAPLIPLAHVAALQGDTTTARATLAELQKMSATQYVPAIYSAVIYVGLGDKDKAFDWLSRANDERCDYLIFLERDPMADPLRDDPRFERLIREISPRTK